MFVRCTCPDLLMYLYRNLFTHLYIFIAIHAYIIAVQNCLLKFRKVCVTITHLDPKLNLLLCVHLSSVVGACIWICNWIQTVETCSCAVCLCLCFSGVQITDAGSCVSTYRSVVISTRPKRLYSQHNSVLL